MRTLLALGLIIIFLASIFSCDAAFWSTPAPNKTDFEDVYSKTTVNIDKDGKIIIKDNNGKTLILQVKLWSGGSETPQGYSLHTRFDKIKVESISDPSIRLALEEEFILHDGRLNEKVDVQRLSEAISALIDWSITAVNTKTKTLTKEISPRIEENDWKSYEFHCDQKLSEFYIFRKAHNYRNAMMFQGMSPDRFQREAGIQWNVDHIISFDRAHLWKYLFDHYENVKALADAYFERDKAIRSSAAKMKREAEEVAASQKTREEQKKAAAEIKERERLNQMFPLPAAR